MPPVAWVRRLMNGYIAFFRNTPPLVQLYFFYFAVNSALSGMLGIRGGILGSYGWAVIACRFSPVLSTPRYSVPASSRYQNPTIEGAQALGYSRFQIYRYITFPLAYRVCLPSLNNNLINLVKTTTVAYAIAVPETLYIANQIWSDEYNVPEMMNVVWIVYLVLVGILVWLMHRWEKAIRVPGFGQ